MRAVAISKFQKFYRDIYIKLSINVYNTLCLILYLLKIIRVNVDNLGTFFEKEQINYR